MSDTANTDTERKATKPRRSLLLRIFRFMVFAGLGLFLLLAVMVGFSETRYFRALLKDFIVTTANTSLNAHFSIDDLDGNLFSGWKLSGVTLHDDHGPVAEIEDIVLRYNLFQLPWKRVTVREISLNSPRFYITRGEGRDWNLNTLLPPSEDEDSVGGEFDWDIYVDHVRIFDGTFVIYDSTTGPPDKSRLDTRHLKIAGLNLALSAVVTPEGKQLSINRCSWENEFGDIAMKNLSGDIHLGEESVELSLLSVQTPRSGFIISARMDSVDLLGGFESNRLDSYPFSLTFDAPNIDLRDLQYFLPSLDILGGTANLELRTNGTLSELNIEHLRLQTFESDIRFAGQLRNILDGASMYIDVTSDGSVINGADIPAVLPGIPLLDLSGLGRAQFSYLRFDGEPLDFLAEVDMTSDAGDIIGSINLTLTGDDMVYDGLVQTSNVDLGAVLGNERLKSALTLRIGMQGSGTRIGSIVSSLNLTADSSRFQRYLVDELRCSVDVRSDSLTLDLTSRLGSSSIAMDGGMSFEPDSITGFHISSDAVALDLAKALNDDDLVSDLTFSLEAHGDGVDPSNASGSLNLILRQSRFANLEIEPDTFRVELQQSENEPEYLLLESQYADARIDGRFDFPRFLTYMDVQLDSLSSALAEYSFIHDSTMVAENHPQIRKDARSAARRNASTLKVQPSPDEIPDTTEFMNARYSIALKHPERIARYFDASTFLLRGNYSGAIRGGMQGFSVDGQLRLSDFYYVDTARTWLAAGVRLNYDIDDLQITDPLENLRMSARLGAVDLHIDGLRMSRTSLQLEFADRKPRLRFRSRIDTLAQVEIEAHAAFNDHVLDIRLPRFDVDYLKEPWTSTREIAIRVDSTGLELRDFELARENMRLSLDGSRSFGGKNDFTFYADSVSIGAVEYYLSSDRAALEGKSFTGTGSVQARITGTDAEPLMAGDIYIEHLGYRGMDFGEMLLEGRYFDRKLELYSELAYPMPDGKDRNVFFASGTIPANITFDGEALELEERNANLRLQMKEFPLALVEDFIGLFSPLTGTVDADISVQGTASNPSFSGFMSVADGRGRFVFNNMDYLLNMRLEAIGQDLRIVEATMRNTPADWSAGAMTATGTINTEAFVISDFDLEVSGRLKVLRPASRSATRGLYGDLFISTGEENLTYRGRLDRSMLLGNIIIEEGDLNIPLDQSQAGQQEYADITYIMVDDTTTAVTSSLSSGSLGVPTAGTVGAEAPERSVMEGLSYALTLATTNPLRVKIPMSFLQEELDVALNLENLKVESFGAGGMKFIGEVTLGQDSYFNYWGKRLATSGSLRFTRDPANPDLDLEALYTEDYINPSTDARRKVFLTIFIKGTKDQPQITYDLRWDRKDGDRVVRSGGDVQMDAYAFLLTGQFMQDLSGGEGEQTDIAAAIPGALGQQLTSTVLSAAATRFVNELGVGSLIKRVDFAHVGTEYSRVKVTGKIGRAIIKYDGRINNPEGADVSVEFPLSKMLGIPWTNLAVQLSRETFDEYYQATVQSQEYSIWELKILQRFSF